MIKANRDKLNEFLKNSQDNNLDIGSDNESLADQGEGFVSPDFLGGFGNILTQINELLNNPIVQNVVLGNTSQKADYSTQDVVSQPQPQPPSEPKFPKPKTNELKPEEKADLQSHLIFTSLIQNINYQIDNNAVFTDLKDLKKEVLASEKGIKENISKLLMVNDDNLKKMKSAKNQKQDEKPKLSDDEKAKAEVQTDLKNKGDIYA